MFHQSNGFSPASTLSSLAVRSGEPGATAVGSRRQRQDQQRRISPDSLSFGVTWRNGASGRYEGTINAATGLMSGYTEDKHGAGSPTASWWSDRPAKCLDVAAKPAAPKPPAPRRRHGSETHQNIRSTRALAWQRLWPAFGTHKPAMGRRYAHPRSTRRRICWGRGPEVERTLQGTLGADGKSMSFVLTQAGAGVTSRGNLSLLGSGDTVSGRITKDTDGVGRAWTGTRRK